MIGNVTLMEFLSAGREVAGHHPWPRYRLDGAGWRAMVEQMTVSNWQVLAQWAEPEEVHVALRDEDTDAIAVVSHPCPDRRFASIGRVRPGAIRLERAIRDLWGLTPVGLPDTRPWLDHGRWPTRHPLSPRRQSAPAHPVVYPFLTAEGEGLHQIPVGPVHAGVIEPGHFRFHAQGETVVRLEERLGYVHKGIAGLVRGKPIADAARIVARTSGDATVAYSLAFARAAEAAAGLEVPARAHHLRALMAECERLANHLFDVGAICNDAAFAVMLSHMGVLRETVLNANASCFGHRLLMDRVVPGGVAADLPAEGQRILAQMVHQVRKGLARAVDLYDSAPSLLDRTNGTGIISAAMAHRFGAGGFVGRAAGRGEDCRKSPGYPPYDQLEFDIPVKPEGDVNARVVIRLEEARTSLSLIEQILASLPDGPVHAPLVPVDGEGMAIVESFRGEVLVWLRLSADGTVAQCHPHDPSWFQWPLLEAAIEGNIVADFPLCNKSFNCSYSGADL